MKRLVFLMSDTGGGHRAACAAIQAALEDLYPGAFACDMLDFYRGLPPILARQPDVYSDWVSSSPWSYMAVVQAMELVGRVSWLRNLMYRWLRRSILGMLRTHPADVYVCAHSAAVHGGLMGLRESGRGTPFLTVVTDYASPYRAWFNPESEVTFVGAPEAARRALRGGVPPDRVRLVGQPIHPRFQGIPDRCEARAALGWPELPTVLLHGGGAAIGRLVEAARAIDSVCQAHLAVVAGTNAALEERLRRTCWQGRVSVYGFLERMELALAAADVVVTKAGPSSLAEAFAAHRPVVIYWAIPYQESGNVTYAVCHGAGLWAPGPVRTAQAVARLLQDPATLAGMSAAAGRLARPNAAHDIAREIYAVVAERSRIR
ncbi:MAG: glycosyltransferase [Candidatus Eremiobacterota bacterium]